MAKSSVDKVGLPLVRDFNDVAGVVWEGKAFGVMVAAADTGITGQTSYAATLATVNLRNLGSKALVPLYAKFTQTGTVAGGRITYHVSTLNIDQFTSATALTVYNLNRNSSVGSTVSASHTATLPTFTAGNQTIVNVGDLFQTVSAVESAGVYDLFPAPGFCVVKPGGSLQIYTDATITGPTWFWAIAWAELDV
jgi:hypothetical protein